MEDFWSNKKIQGYFTLHDASHSAGVEYSLYKLIPLQNKIVPMDGKSQFDSQDWFYLVAAAWLHDVGMVPNILRNDPITGVSLDDFEKARKSHNLRSKQYINENYKLIGLTETERDNLGVICEFHRKSMDINKCPKAFNANLQLLAAYLRLADGIHINYERIDENLLGLFELIGMPEESRFHWIKSKLTHDVVPDPNNLTISIPLKFSKHDNKFSHLVSNSIREDVKNELSSVRDILIRGGITYYLDVQVIESEIEADQNIKEELQQMINNIQLNTWASASDVFESIVSSILYLNTFDDKDKAMFILGKYQERIITENLKIRSCHIMLDKIFNIVSISLAAADTIDSHKILDNLKSEVLNIKADRDKAIEKIAENAKPVLSDGEPILLFGHSKIVIEALDRIDEGIKKITNIYVLEGRNSGRYSYSNEIEYCDGLEYSIAVKEKGFPNVFLVPDILVGNLLVRTKDKVRKIVFGANGIDINEISFGHTAGHLAIAKLGKLLNVPIYVLADCFKFGELKFKEDIERKNAWLMGEGSINYSRIDGIKIFNPREDKVNNDDITYLITELGMFPPHQLPEIVKNRYSQFMQRLDELKTQK